MTILPGVILAAAPPHPHPQGVGLVLVARHLLLLLPPLLRADNLVGSNACGLLDSISGSSRWCRGLALCLVLLESCSGDLDPQDFEDQLHATGYAKRRSE